MYFSLYWVSYTKTCLSEGTETTSSFVPSLSTSPISNPLTDLLIVLILVNSVSDGVGDGLGVGTVTLLYVTVIVSVPELPAPSFAVTVIILSPLDRLILEIVQLAVPVAVPFPPLLLLHVALLIPLVLSDALPPRLMVLLVDV